MFLGLQVPDPSLFVSGLDPDRNPDPSIIKQKARKAFVSTTVL
jgi:hypothetical protein